jgi:hypothetical protein
MLARRSLGGLVSQNLPPIGRTPRFTSVPGVLTIRWWPIDHIFVREGGRLDPGMRDLGRLIPGFILAARKEPGIEYPSSYTLGLALSAFHKTKVVALHPSQKPPGEGVWPMWSYWIAAECIGPLIARTFAPSMFFGARGAAAKRLAPATFDDFEEAKIKEWVEAFESKRAACRMAHYQYTFSRGQAEALVGMRWTAALQDLLDIYRYKRDLFEKRARGETGSMEWLAWVEALDAAMLKIMVTRKRDKTGGHPIADEWKPLVERAEAQMLFPGPGRPRGPSKVIVTRQIPGAGPPRALLPGMPTAVRSEIPGEEEFIVREIPWKPPGDED